jgi:hypothetical protein
MCARVTQLQVKRSFWSGPGYLLNNPRAREERAVADWLGSEHTEPAPWPAAYRAFCGLCTDFNLLVDKYDGTPEELVAALPAKTEWDADGVSIMLPEDMSNREYDVLRAAMSAL